MPSTRESMLLVKSIIEHSPSPQELQRMAKLVRDSMPSDKPKLSVSELSANFTSDRSRSLLSESNDISREILATLLESSASSSATASLANRRALFANIIATIAAIMAAIAAIPEINSMFSK
jgi:hypothetical protein